MQQRPRSVFLDLDGPVHVADHGGDATLPLVLCVHGLAGRQENWHALADELRGRARLLAVDLPGHGSSPLEGRSVGVAANLAVLEGVVDQLVRGPFTLVGHSMGAALSVLYTARHPGSVHRLGLLAPPAPRSVVDPLTRHLAAHAAVCALPSFGHQRLGRHLLADRLGSSPPDHAVAVFVEAARSVGALVLRSQEYRSAITAVDCPTVVLHGSQDPVAPPATMRRLTALRSDWHPHLLPGVGHSPHRQVPGLVAAHLVEDARAVPVQRRSARSARSSSRRGERAHTGG